MLLHQLSSFPSFHLPLLVSFLLTPYSTRTQCVFSCILSSKIVLSLIALLSSVLIFWDFRIIVVLISRASMEHECVDADIDEGGL